MVTEDSLGREKRANKGEEVGNRGAVWGKELPQQKTQRRPDGKVVGDKRLGGETHHAGGEERGGQTCTNVDKSEK